VDLSELGLFHRTHFAVDDHDRIALIDSRDLKLLFLDFHGNILARAGGRGEGPGEFTKPGEIYWIQRDRIFIVSDFGNDRFSFWSQDGQLVREYDKPLGTANPKFLDSNRLLLAKYKRGEGTRTPTLLLHRLAEAESEPLWHYPGKKHRKYKSFEERLRRYTPWDTMLLFGAGSDFIVVNYSSEADLTILTFDGQPTDMRFTTGMARPRLQSASIESWLRRQPEQLRGELKRNLITPGYWPAASYLTVDADDRIWVFGFREKAGVPIPLRVLSKTGKEQATGSFPDYIPYVIQSDNLFCYENSEEKIIVKKVSYRFK
jgi:hypothetical protein